VKPNAQVMGQRDLFPGIRTPQLNHDWLAGPELHVSLARRASGEVRHRLVQPILFLPEYPVEDFVLRLMENSVCNSDSEFIDGLSPKWGMSPNN